MNSKVIVLKNGKVVDSESMRVVIADVVPTIMNVTTLLGCWNAMLRA